MYTKSSTQNVKFIKLENKLFCCLGVWSHPSYVATGSHLGCPALNVALLLTHIAPYHQYY